MNIEELGRDATGKISSQPTIKAGKNRGWRRKEVGGTKCKWGTTFENQEL